MIDASTCRSLLLLFFSLSLPLNALEDDKRHIKLEFNKHGRFLISDLSKRAVKTKSTPSPCHTMDAVARLLAPFARPSTTFSSSNPTKKSPKPGTQPDESLAVAARQPKRRFTSSLLSVC